jgi:AcrR family transcriptional regulator
MVSVLSRERVRKAGEQLLPTNGASFDRRLREILDHATAVFCEKGYAGASMRDLQRATGMSLAGMYHYFGSKERLLYLIQKHTFSTILKRLGERLSGATSAKQGIGIFILNHLQYFLEHQQAMKVLSHEDEALTGQAGQEIREIKRQYYRSCRALVERYRRENGLQFDTRIAVLSLFGMINWIYTWYNPRLDGGAKPLAREMTKIFLHGVAGRGQPKLRLRRRSRRLKKRNVKAAMSST